MGPRPLAIVCLYGADERDGLQLGAGWSFKSSQRKASLLQNIIQGLKTWRGYAVNL